MTPHESEAFRTYCVLQQFDLQEFDAWLSTMADHPVHKELTERRALAWAAARINEHQAALRHLEWMLLRWRWISRVDALLPMAQLGKAFTGGRKAGTVSSVRKFVRNYMRENPHAKTAEVWSAIAKKPPRGVDVYEESGRVKPYVRTEGRPDTSYRQFANIVSEERPKEA